MNDTYPDGPRLLADIGASNARFALETALGRIGDLATLPCAHYRRFEDAAVDYLASVAHCHRGRIRHAVVALLDTAAGPGAQPWTLAIGAARAELRLDTLLVLSDAAAPDNPRAAPARGVAGFTWLITASPPAQHGAAATLSAALARVDAVLRGATSHAKVKHPAHAR